MLLSTATLGVRRSTELKIYYKYNNDVLGMDECHHRNARGHSGRE